MYKDKQSTWYLFDELQSSIELTLSVKNYERSYEYIRTVNRSLQTAIQGISTTMVSLASHCNSASTVSQPMLSALTQDLLAATVSTNDSKGEFQTNNVCSLYKLMGNTICELEVAKQLLSWMQRIVRTEREQQIYCDLVTHFEQSCALCSTTLEELKTAREDENLRVLFEGLASLRAKYGPVPENEQVISPAVAVLTEECQKRLSKIRTWSQKLPRMRDFVHSEVCYALYADDVARDDTCLYTSYSTFNNQESMIFLAHAAIGQALKIISAHGICYIKTDKPYNPQRITVLNYWAGLWRTQDVLRRTKLLIRLAGILSRSDAERARVKSLAKQYAELLRQCSRELRSINNPKEGSLISIDSLEKLFVAVGKLRDTVCARQSIREAHQRPPFHTATGN